jgi:hypothetical protein
MDKRIERALLASFWAYVPQPIFDSEFMPAPAIGNLVPAHIQLSAGLTAMFMVRAICRKYTAKADSILPAQFEV